MALKFKITKAEYDGLDEGLKKLYGEKDGEYQIGIEGLPAPEDTVGLKSALEKEREAKKSTQTKLSEITKILESFNSLEMTPDKIRDLKQQMDEITTKSLEDKGKWEELKARLVRDNQEALSAKDKQVKELEEAISSFKTAKMDSDMNAAAITAISACKGKAKALLPHVKTHLSYDDESGTVFVLSDDGKGKRLNAKGEAMSIEDFVSGFKEDPDFAGCFDPTGISGSGTKPGNGGGGDSKFVISRADMQSDFAKYRALRDEASKAGQELEITD